jgi:hypothetical protein
MRLLCIKEAAAAAAPLGGHIPYVVASGAEKQMVDVHT